jgi:hypothetical protein
MIIDGSEVRSERREARSERCRKCCREATTELSQGASNAVIADNEVKRRERRELIWNGKSRVQVAREREPYRDSR